MNGGSKTLNHSLVHEVNHLFVRLSAFFSSLGYGMLVNADLGQYVITY